MKKLFRWIVLAGLVLLVGIQFIPVRRTNPPVTGDIPAPPEIKTLLRNACYDCHSHETVWPWYSRVAPSSWLLASDVKEARGMMNFSTWKDCKPAKQGVLLEDAIEQVQQGEMPPFYYAWMHPNARLTDAQKVQLTTWMKSASVE
jgi:hypothetical protein